MNNRYCIIMAGGIGSRFWPLSRVEKPKQFVDALGIGRTFIQQTYDRFSKFIPDENFLVMTGEDYKDMVLEQLPMLTEEQVLTEPCRRNTAPCIAYAMFRLLCKNPNAIAVVTPSDQYIGNEKSFSKVIGESMAFAECNTALLTIGIRPTFPATGYGYIKSEIKEGVSITPVETFKEKPDLQTAMSYLNDGNYFWNSGIFVWSVKTIVGALKKFLPEVADKFEKIGASYYTVDEKENVNKAFSECMSVSIDYGVMEKADNVFVRYADDLAWSDVGSWGALYDLLEKDLCANSASGSENIFLTNANNNLVKETNPKKQVVVDGLSGYLIADTHDVLMICPLADEVKIKALIEKVSSK